jgi:hypothetical protein
MPNLTQIWSQVTKVSGVVISAPMCVGINQGVQEGWNSRAQHLFIPLLPTFSLKTGASDNSREHQSDPTIDSQCLQVALFSPSQKHQRSSINATAKLVQEKCSLEYLFGDIFGIHSRELQWGHLKPMSSDTTIPKFYHHSGEHQKSHAHLDFLQPTDKSTKFQWVIRCPHQRALVTSSSLSGTWWSYSLVPIKEIWQLVSSKILHQQ